MYTDINGKKRQKVALHLHTTLSDGSCTPNEVIASYKEQGFDAVALTDHWKYGEAGIVDGTTVISGAEYNLGHATEKGVYHIVGLFMKRDPEVLKKDTTQEIIDKIHSVNGLAVLAHPAWSLNTPEMILSLRDIDATEIYNAVSEKGQSFRPDSSLIVDMLASRGVEYPLLATDDAHYYDGDQMRGITMLEADAVEELGVAGAIKAGRFYSTQGPEIHLEQVSEKRFRVRCTPVSKIVFLSNLPWAPNRVQKGDGLTEAYFDLDPRGYETFLRAEVTDRDGRCGWSNIIML